jgi:hypothetical protein
MFPPVSAPLKRNGALRQSYHGSHHSQSYSIVESLSYCGQRGSGGHYGDGQSEVNRAARTSGRDSLCVCMLAICIESADVQGGSTKVEQHSSSSYVNTENLLELFKTIWDFFILHYLEAP